MAVRGHQVISVNGEKRCSVDYKEDIMLIRRHMMMRRGSIRSFLADSGSLILDSHIRNPQPSPTTAEYSQRTRKRCSAFSAAP